ncbi:MAG TPA: tetratricopeptide repeat protein [Verrucomicrobiae bacterium]|nr:tetratricopeptide repeat protein [Verrucomicrobiae bacterium]
MAGRVALLVIFLTVFAAGQSSSTPKEAGIPRRIHVSINGPHSCRPSTHLALIAGTGAIPAEGFAKGKCIVEFASLPAGHYHAIVTGTGVEEAEATDIDIAPTMRDIEVKVSPASDAANRVRGVLISAVDLRVRAKATKKLIEANQFIGKEKWAEAIEPLREAIATDPAYVDPYNNLAVAYVHLGQTTEAADTLERAIAIENHFLLGYINLSRLHSAASDYGGAEALLSKVLTLGSSDRVTYCLLAYAQFQVQHFEQAIATSQRGHTLLRVPHGFLHLVAAHAYAHLGKMDRAVAELSSYLREEPNGDRAAEVRQSITNLQVAANGSVPLTGTDLTAPPASLCPSTGEAASCGQ